jgi:small nuclear ribonucleoprotein D2
MDEEKKRTQEETFNVGPFSLLTKSVKANNEVLIALRNNRKLLGRVKAFDRHMNMVMENVQEVWTEMPRKGKAGKPITKNRYIPKMFLRGDSVIYILKNPN